MLPPSARIPGNPRSPSPGFHHRTRRNPDALRSFTLVELLVVIAILSLLLGLLAPALKSARNSAKAMICLNNLKQLGASMQIYANDHEGLLPEVWDGARSWSQILSVSGTTPDVTQAQNFSLWHCPTWPPTSGSSIMQTYGLVIDEETVAAIFNQRITDLSPSSVLIADSILDPDTVGGDGEQFYYITRKFDTSGKRVHRRHKNRANAVFVDGHAAAVGEQEIRDSGFTGSRVSINYGNQ